MDDARVDAYLNRIEATRPSRPDAEALRDLQYRHLLAVPFENLGIHLGEPIVLDEDPILAKIVDQRRGGFCYELNGAFGALLRDLGFTAELLCGRVLTSGTPGPPYDHMAVRVYVEGDPRPWLAEVGFGRFSHYPLRLDERGEQVDPAGTFTIVEREDGDLDVLCDGRPQYRLEQRTRELVDFEATSWWHQTSPKSLFTQSTVCSLLTETGRVTLSEGVLIETVNGERKEQKLVDDADVLAAYRDRFGVVLDRVPVRKQLG